jgi:hypothetical protein
VRTGFVTAALLACAIAVSAHHSIAGVYDQQAPVTLTGSVSDFRFVNPHPFLTIAVERDGRVETWKLELDNRFELVDVGMSADTFRRGDQIVVKGGPARDKSHALYAMRIDRRADGFWYEQVGSSPRIRR